MSAYDRAIVIQGLYTASPTAASDGSRILLATDPLGNLKTLSTSSPALSTPVAGTNSQIITGGTPVIAVTGPCTGGYITNPPNLASQGIATAENLYVNPVAAPGSTDATANGTTVLLTSGQNYTIPALASGQVIKVNAATSGHKFTVVVYT